MTDPRIIAAPLPGRERRAADLAEGVEALEAAWLALIGYYISDEGDLFACLDQMRVALSAVRLAAGIYGPPRVGGRQLVSDPDRVNAAGE